MKTIRTILKKSKLCFMLLACIILFSSCSNSESKQEDNNDLLNDSAVANNEEQKNTTSNENSENDFSNSNTEDNVPNSEFFISKITIGSFFYKSTLDIGSDFEKEIIETLSEFNATDTDKGTMLTLPDNILFDFDSDQLRAEADKAIKQLVQVIESSDGNVTIVGHTDSHGEDNYNQKLSERRADAVLQAIAAKGVDKNRLKSEGKGATEPVARNANSDGSDNPEGRQKNRRVEVTIQGLN